MPLTLILGPANSAKAGEVLGAYAAAARRDALLVVPTAADAAHYDRELAGEGVLLGRCLTFSGLAAEIARRAGYTAVRCSARQRDRVLRRALRTLEFDALRESAATPGFPAAAGTLIAELERGRVSPQRFSAALSRWAEEHPGRSSYAHDLASVYFAYTRELERIGRLDAELFAWRALDALRAAPRRWGATPVFFYGFDDMTALERDAIETLSRIVEAQVTASLTCEPGRVALSARATVAEELRAIATTVRTLPAGAEYYADGARAALHQLERFIFEQAPARLEPGDAVRLMEAGGELAEAELIAAEVLTSLRSGVKAEEIVVVCRSLQRSGALLERVLQRHGVDAASDRVIPVSHTGLGRALLALARCALLGAAEASAEDLLSYLRAPGVLANIGALDVLEATVRRRALRTAGQARAASGLTLGEIDSLRAARDPGAELARQARRLLAAPHRARAARLDADEELDARAAAVILDALRECGELGERLTGDEALDLLGGLEVRAGSPPHDGSVLIAEPLAIRARRFRVVLISGLCEGEFPAAGGIDPFLGDERRHELALATGLALGSNEDALARERYLLYACVSRATERVVLSYRSSDEEGRALAPSPFIDDVAELFTPELVTHRRRRMLADVVWSPEEAPTARELQYARAAAAAADAAPARASAARAPLVRTLGETAMRHVRHRELVSGGALEAFAACPVNWLIERQLQPRELEPEPEALVRGSFMHDVLERLIGTLGAPVTPASLPRAQELLGELAAELPEALGAGRPDAVRAAIRRGIEADLRRYLISEAADGCDWVPHALEQRFGFDDDPESLAAVVLSAGEEQVRLRGMIDRIDVEADGGRRAVIRDYKSGANAIKRAGARWSTEHELQVGLYMIAVRRLLGLDPVAGFFQPLTGRDLRPRGAYLEGLRLSSHAYATDAFERPALDELLDQVELDAVTIALVMRRGELTPCPATCSRDGCRHPGICWAG